MFSVVIPVYNKRPHLERAVNSVLKQSFGEYELILVDDGSTDGSRELVADLGKKANVRSFFRDTPGPGGYAARNFGIEKAGFEWVAFLDADDAWDLDRLAQMADLSRQFPDADFLSSGWNEFFVNGETVADYYTQAHPGEPSHYFDLRTLLKDKQMVCTTVAIIKKEVLLAVGGFDVTWKRGADLDMWLRVLLHGVKGAWLNRINATYFRDSVNMVTENVEYIISPVMPTIRRYLKQHPQDLHKVVLEQYSNRLTFITVKRLLVTNKPYRATGWDYFYFNVSNINKIYIGFLAIFFLPKAISRLLIRRRIL